MASSRHSLRAIAASVVRDEDRHLDLRVDLVAQDARGQLQDDGEQLLSVGGRWNTLERRYDAEAATSRALGLHGGQLEAARWLTRWFQAKAEKQTLREGGRAIYSVLLHGGRRAGKTDLAAKAGVAYAVFRPRSFVWLISENIPKTEELEADVRRWLPSGWYKHRGAPWYQFILPNGSVIWLRSAHKPQSLKRGRCDFAVLNEAQNMSEEAFAIVRASTADNGGLTVLAANPPETASGFWVERFFEESRAGKRPAKEFRLDAQQNPHVDHESLAGMKDELDERTYRREILGEFLPREDVVFHAWSPSSGPDSNIRPMPQLPNADCTRAFTRKHFAREFDVVLGVDMQRDPVCAVELRFFVDPEEPTGEPLIWTPAAICVENGYEEDLSAELYSRGYDPERTALILDASGAFQGIDRTKRTPSFELFKKFGWKHLYKPDRNMEKNPGILERVRATNARMKSASGKRRLFSTPENLELNEAVKLWENRNGVPYRRSKFAHLCDGLSYPIWRFYPRAGKTRNVAPPAGAIQVVTVGPQGPRTV